jgi:hypothetical protein
MTKYVDKKHGIILGSGNVFFITNDKHAPDGIPQIRDGYGAIVWLKSYDFDHVNTLNVRVRTPADQIIWNRQTEKYTEEFDGLSLPMYRDYRELNSHFIGWLEKNVGNRYGEWDVRHKPEELSPAIFFKRRKDALAFIKEVERLLDGISFERS